MTIEVKVPELGESVVEATIGTWHKQKGDMIQVGDILVDLETDKVDVEVGAESAGILLEIVQPEGEDVMVGDVLAIIDGEASAPAEAPAPETTTPAPAPSKTEEVKVTPVAKRMAADKGVDLAEVTGTGSGGRITKEDVQAVSQPTPQPKPSQPVAQAPTQQQSAPQIPALPFMQRPEREERIKMSRRRRTIAKRLVEAQQTAAMLTTFNEMDMSAVMALRNRRKQSFVDKHGVKLGFTSFFVKAAVGALRAFPRLNAEIDGDEMILKHYYDIGIAVGAEEGLVVPVLRDADQLSFAKIEDKVRNFAIQARDGSLKLEDLLGGTFTLTNGGVFGSLMSTPILNPPQVGIIGLHGIKDRPIVVDGKMEIRPMMYIALSYDHRIVDGSEAVRFLVRFKELVEDPESLLIDG